MDIQQVAKQLINYSGKNPQLIMQLIEHPYSTTAKATGSDAQISKKDMSQILTAAAALASGQQLGGSDVANIASALLGQNNNSVHSLTSMLFGGGNTAQATAAAQANTTQAGTLDLGSLVSMAALAATLMGGASAANQQQQQVQQQVLQAQQQAARPNVNLADGLDILEIAQLAGQFLGSGATQQAAVPQVAPRPQSAAVKPTAPQQVAQVPQQQAAGLDFGTIAQLASLFLSQR
jgi:hypothetical protein